MDLATGLTRQGICFAERVGVCLVFEGMVVELVGHRHHAVPQFAIGAERQRDHTGGVGLQRQDAEIGHQTDVFRAQLRVLVVPAQLPSGVIARQGDDTALDRHCATAACGIGSGFSRRPLVQLGDARLQSVHGIEVFIHPPLVDSTQPTTQSLGIIEYQIDHQAII